MVRTSWIREVRNGPVAQSLARLLAPHCSLWLLRTARFDCSELLASIARSAVLIHSIARSFANFWEIGSCLRIKCVDFKPFQLIVDRLQWKKECTKWVILWIREYSFVTLFLTNDAYSTLHPLQRYLNEVTRTWLAGDGNSPRQRKATSKITW